MTLDRRLANKQSKVKDLVEQQRLRLEDLAEKEALDNAKLFDEDDDSDLDSEDRAYKRAEAEDKKIAEGADVESSGESDLDDNLRGTSLFVNPLAKKRAKGESSEEWSDDNFSDGGKKGKGKKTKKETVLGKRKRKGSLDNIQEFFGKEEIEEVPANDPGTLAE